MPDAAELIYFRFDRSVVNYQYLWMIEMILYIFCFFSRD